MLPSLLPSDLETAAEMWELVLVKGLMLTGRMFRSRLCVRLVAESGRPRRHYGCAGAGLSDWKLVHRKCRIATVGGDPPYLSTRPQGTFAVKKPPPSFQAQRAQSLVLRFTADSAYGSLDWDTLSKNPAKYARVWASDTCGFARHGSTRITGLMRVRDRSPPVLSSSST